MAGQGAKIVLAFGLLAVGTCVYHSQAQGGGAPAKTPAEHAAPAGDAHAAAKADGHGEAAAKGGEHGEAAAAGPTPYPMDPPLNGFFDIKVLRRAERVREFRRELSGIEDFIGHRNDWQLHISVVVEFGSGGGVTELGEREQLARLDIQKMMRGFEGRELLRPDGMYRLKEQIVVALNRRLRTAQVRQVYLTEFRLVYLKQPAENS